MARREGFLSNQAAQGKLRGHENRGEYRRETCLRAVMTTREGREFVYDLIFDRCGLKHVRMSNDSELPVLEGRRQVGGLLDKELQENMPDLYVTMISEAVKIEQERQKAYVAAKTISEGDEQ